MQPIENATPDSENEAVEINDADRDAFYRCVDAIYNEGHRDGKARGYKNGRAEFSPLFKALFLSGGFLFGAVLGGTFGTMSIVILLKLNS